MESGIADRIPELLHVIAASYEQPIIGYGLSLLSGLVAIELVWVFARLGLAHAPLESFVEEVVRQIMIIGLFVFLITNGPWLAETIISSFQQAGAANGGSAMSPSGVLESGLSLMNNIWQGATLSFDAIPRFFTGIAIMLCFMWIAANIVIALAESYIVAAGAALLLGFGGSMWTREFAIAVTRYVFSVGVKLFVLQLLVSLGMEIARTIHAAPITGIEDAAVALGISGILAGMTASIPGLAQSFISGASLSTAAHAIAGAGAGKAAVAASIASPAVAGAGGVMATLQAARLSHAKMQGSDTAPSSLPGRVASVALGTAGQLSKGVIAGVGDRLSGRAPPRGSLLWGASANLADQARQQRADNDKPKAA